MLCVNKLEREVESGASDSNEARSSLLSCFMRSLGIVVLIQTSSVGTGF